MWCWCSSLRFMYMTRAQFFSLIYVIHSSQWNYDYCDSYGRSVDGPGFSSLNLRSACFRMLQVNWRHELIELSQEWHRSMMDLLGDYLFNDRWGSKWTKHNLSSSYPEPIVRLVLMSLLNSNVGNGRKSCIPKMSHIWTWVKRFYEFTELKSMIWP